MRGIIRGICFLTSPRRGYFRIVLFGSLCITGFLLFANTGKQYSTHLNKVYSFEETEAKNRYQEQPRARPNSSEEILQPNYDETHLYHHPDGENVTNRHVILQERCKQLQLGKYMVMQTSFRRNSLPIVPAIISTNFNFLFCPLTKAGSTFFKRYIVALERGTPGLTPFDIKIEDSRAVLLPNLGSLRDLSTRMKFVKDSYKFVFTRDPYWRIFSTYIDKLFSPNIYYWADWGQKAIQLFNLSKEAHPCGSRISFPDLVGTVIASLHETDVHFIPMTKMCHLCDLKYDLVGKAEHAIPEIDYLARKINVSAAFQHDENYRKATAFDVIYDSTKDVYQSWLQKLKSCVSGYEMNRIIWRRLQVRGVIDADIHFPLSKEEANSITKEEFRILCREAVENSTDASKLKRQKLEAFVEAYKTVSFDQLLKIQEIYKHDFLLLGYDLTPELIYKADRSTVNDKILDYMQEWR